MLSCKTDSAKLRKPGGPVSRPCTTALAVGGLVTNSQAYCALVALLPVKVSTLLNDFATTARTSLQQGVFAAGFFFSGALCIGQLSPASSA